MSKKIIQRVSSLIAGLMYVSVGGYAMAQETPAGECVGLDQNEQWLITFSEFSEEYSLGNYQKAEEKIHQLLGICASSPLVNYSAGMTYMALNQIDKACKAYLDALKNTQYFVVDDNFYKKMVDAYYKAEHADEICEKKDLTQCQTEKETANLQIQALNERLNKSIEGLVIEDLKSQELKRYGAVMWTGTGLGIAGLGMAIAGGFFLFSDAKITDIKTIGNEPDANPGNSSKDKDKVYQITYKSSVVPGAILLGVGGGMLVAGAIMAGIGGYHYTHTIADDVTMSWNVAPNQLQFGMTF